MLENIISLVKDQVMDKLSGDPEIPDDKKTEVAQTTTSSIIEGLKQYATPENISSLTSMLGIGGGSKSEHSAEIQQSNITQGVQSNVISNLTSKTGLSSGTATKIAMMVVPAVIALFSKKANDSNDSGFNIGSLLSAFTGGGSSSSSGGGKGIMDMVGSLFGK